MAKKTMQDLADAVGVSRITVWKALSNRPGVSEAMRQTIREKARELGFAPMAAESRLTFSVVVSRPDSSAFWMQIIHHIAKELTLHHVNLMYTYMPSAYAPGYALPDSLRAVDGLIVLNIYDETLLRMLAALSMPKVFLDTVPSLSPAQLNGDLVILDGCTTIRQITLRLLKSGRTRLGFVGDVNYAQTNTERYRGFLEAHQLLGLAADERLSMTGPISLSHHYEEISRFLDSLPQLPDGFVCPSDFIAHFISRYLTETGREPPAGFALTGFDNNSEYTNVADAITTVDVDTSALGKRLAGKLLFRAQHPGMPDEVSYVSTEVLYRGVLGGIS